MQTGALLRFGTLIYSWSKLSLPLLLLLPASWFPRQPCLGAASTCHVLFFPRNLIVFYEIVTSQPFGRCPLYTLLQTYPAPHATPELATQSANGNTLQVLKFKPLKRGSECNPTHRFQVSIRHILCFSTLLKLKEKLQTQPKACQSLLSHSFLMMIILLKLVFVKPIRIFVLLSCMYYAILDFNYLFI